MKSTLKELFESAKYKKILEIIDSLKGKAQYNYSQYHVGALVFLGKDELARSVKEEIESPQESFEAQFFLFLSSVRREDYVVMTKSLTALFLTYQKLRNERNKFFIHQAMGILSYYKGEFARAESHSRESYRIAIGLEDSYLCLLASDLLGHSLSMQEKYAQGLRYLDESRGYGQDIRNNANQAVIDVAMMTYKVEAGWELKDVEGGLSAWMSTIQSEDYFTRTNAMILQTKLLLLKGDFTQAEELLLKIGRHVYEYNHKRQILDFNLLMAQVNLIFQRNEQALALIRTSLQICQKGKDFYHTLRLRELEQYAMNDHTQTFEESFERKTGRAFRKKYPLTIIPEENVEKRLRGVSIEKGISPEVLSKLENENLLGILGLSGIYPLHNFIDDRLPGRDLLIFTQGSYRIIRNLTGQQYQLVKLLIERHIWTKKELVETFWNTTYDSFIHDNKVYVTLKRLEKRLCFSLFHFNRGRIVVDDFRLLNTKREEVLVSSILRESHEGLNIRQRSFLESSQEGQAFSPREYAQVFGISRNTCTRDLKALEDLSYLKREGKGRGTYYLVLSEHLTS